jgi:hypothetical protein
MRLSNHTDWMDDNINSNSRERASDYENEYDYWRTCIDLAKKGLKKFDSRAEKLSRAYAAKSSWETDSLLDPKQPYHVFYSNISTLQPAVYAQPPKVVAQRRFKDKDPVGRLAAQIIERATQSSLDHEDFDPAVKALRDDWLIRGRGVARENFEAVTGEKQDSTGTFEDVLGARTVTRYVHWRDFIYPNCRNWADVQKRWIGFKVLMTRDELVQRFGKAGETVTLDAVPSDVSKSEQIQDKEPFKQATIYEIWDASKKRVLWLSASETGSKELLDQQPDPLGLQQFYPCPRPIFSTLDNDDLYPTADFCFYSNQAEQLNLIEYKISILIRSLKVVGARDATCKELDRILSENCEFELIPVENWPVFAEKGGLTNAIVWMPLGEIVQTLESLYIAKERTLAGLYEISGMSDIIRGYSDPRATATAENLKAQFSAPRLDERKREMQRFLRDLVRIKAEIIAEKFTDENLYIIADVDQMDAEQQQLFPQAVALLRTDKLRTFRIDIETDSTIAEDSAQVRQERMAVVEYISKAVKDAGPTVQQTPELLPLFREAILFGMRAFKESRGLEAAVETTFDTLQQKVEQPAPEQQQPDPAMMELQAKAQAEGQKLQLQAQLEQAKLELEQQKFQFDAQMKQADQQLKREEIAAKLQAEQTKYQAELTKLQQEYDVSMRKLAIEGQKSEREQAIQLMTSQQQVGAPAGESSSPVVHVHTGSSKKMVNLVRDPMTGMLGGTVEDVIE